MEYFYLQTPAALNWFFVFNLYFLCIYIMFITWTKLVRPQNKQDMIMITKMG